jgi:hypothetical protein
MTGVTRLFPSYPSFFRPHLGTTPVDVFRRFIVHQVTSRITT